MRRVRGLGGCAFVENNALLRWWLFWVVPGANVPVVCNVSGGGSGFWQDLLLRPLDSITGVSVYVVDPSWAGRVVGWNAGR